jgi:gamma-glutamyltranspeptidase/glutathione hydrolase
MIPVRARRRLAPLLAALLAFAAPTAPDARVPQQRQAAAETEMVSAADPRATAAGAEILRAGGNATDAALATMLALTVVEPQSSGIGGGGYLLHGDAAGHVATIDGREYAPAKATPDWWLVDGQPMPFRDAQPGGRSVGVPGAVALAAMAHRRWGKLPWARLFEPAIRLAKEGFVVTPRLNASLTRSAATGALDPYARSLFYTANGEAVPAGTRVRNPELAAFLGRLASQGPDAFYAGSNRAAIVATVDGSAHNPSTMSEDDIASYQPIARDAVCAPYRVWRICGMGPSSAGMTTVYAILKQLERFDLGALGPASVTSWHLIAESMRLAYADRARYLGDPGFVTVPLRGLTDPTYLASRSALIDPAQTMARVTAGTPPGAETLSRADMPEAVEHGTTHFVAVDRWGGAVSFTNTIESAFGSGLVVNGYFLNNELTDFDFRPEMDGRPAANAVGPRKRPRSSMAPTLVYDQSGHLRLAIGAAGGATIPAQVAKAIIGVLDWKLSAQEAVALPQLYAPTDTVRVEQGTWLEAMIPALVALGHADVRPMEGGFKANAIEVVGGHLAGAVDPRSEGAVAGP